MKYIILSDSINKQPFVIPRQLTEINGEPIIKRTIRLLKENGINDIIVTSHDKRFDNLGATRYEPKHNDYNGKERTGYWLNAFPIELLNEPITFLFGDVYYSKKAIKKIVETEAKDNLFFCTYQNHSCRYIKHHDEPLAYKVVDYETFKEHIKRVKTLKDEGKCCREPIVWELYRSLNGLNINEHKMTKNYVAINDESCDIDTINDIILLNEKIGGIKMVKCETIKEFTLTRYDELENIVRKNKEENGRLFVGDVFECSEDIADYLTGKNPIKAVVVKVLEVIKEAEITEKEEPKKELKEEINEEKVEVKETKKTRKSKKKK